MSIKKLIILKKLKNDNTSSQLSTEESVNKKSNVAKEIDNTQLLITERIDKKNSQKEKKKIVLKKIYKFIFLHNPKYRNFLYNFSLFYY